MKNIDKNNNNKIYQNRNYANGSVTFLDVLGWKGIWQKRKDAITTLLTLIKEIETYSEYITDEASNTREEARGTNTTVLSISDTIAIFTPGDPKITIPIHAKICSNAIPLSIEKRIPLKGAISYGKFSFEKNIMVGPAVDEAASWHEATDWIGVVLTPSAKFNIDDVKLFDCVTEYNSIPFKKKVNNLNLCVKWAFNKREEINIIFNDMGPHIPEIAPKYLNTLEFINTVNRNRR
ncbi:hypothetical protein EXM98_02925 [Clostridium botulinum]|uniref:hypothetical protein n=1 Tax=Clostridium botulinum TaxID=1491 RepID=UPI0005F98F1F|nr:hypothetical protein [Clostridium botulinum]MBN3346147.1 hypothetical protein [Clostridium botulinum]NFC28018.1 hypothetical protein [Clostridium botulinum]NFC61375.1 hypothetical protein [Clostridium botulinum]NFC68211.1 hypothetical protein [Clostridium botulinum]NFE36935.1 hypothetical protein [Clostridium botulinum]